MVEGVYVASLGLSASLSQSIFSVVQLGHLTSVVFSREH